MQSIPVCKCFTCHQYEYIIQALLCHPKLEQKKDLQTLTHILKKIYIGSMIRKYHNHKLQTNPWHREEEPHRITRHQEDKQEYH